MNKLYLSAAFGVLVILGTAEDVAAKVVHVSSVSEPQARLVGNYDNLPLLSVTDVLLPENWKLYSPNKNLHVSWKHGETWVDVLGGIANKENLDLRIDWIKKEARFSPIKSQSNPVPAIAEKSEKPLSNDTLIKKPKPVKKAVTAAQKPPKALEKKKEVSLSDNQAAPDQAIKSPKPETIQKKIVEKKKPQDSLRVFPVKKGTLKLNAERLSQLFGLTIAGWKASNFMIDVPYSISFKTVDEGLGMLLKGYPVQAQIIESGIESAPDQVVFVPRRALSTREYK